MRDSTKQSLLLILMTAFFASLFLPDMPVVTNVIIGAIVLVCFLYNTVKAKWRCLAQRPMLLLILLFYAAQIVSAAVSVDHHEAMRLLVRRCPLLVFPLSVGAIFIPLRFFHRILLHYAVTTTLAALVFLTWSLARVWRTGDTQWLYDDSLTALMKHPSTYMAWMVTLALFCYFAALRRLEFSGKQKALIYAAVALLLGFHYLLASRSSILFLYSAILCYTIFLILKKRNTTILISSLATIVAFAAVMLIVFPKTLNRFRELQYTGYDLQSHGIESHYNMAVTRDQWNGANIRLALWHCGLELARRHWLTGIPLGDKDTAIRLEYRNQGFEFAYTHKRNLHNTFLDVLVNTGINGLLIFVAAFVVLPLVVAVKQRNLFAIAVSAALAVAMFTENWLDQNLGCLLAGFWLSFIAAGYSPLSRIYNRTASSVSPK